MKNGLNLLSAVAIADWDCARQILDQDSDPELRSIPGVLREVEYCKKQIDHYKAMIVKMQSFVDAMQVKKG